MRCRMCNKLLEGDELYRKGLDEDCCYVCVPMDEEADGEIPRDLLDLFDDIDELDDTDCDISQTIQGEE